MLLMFNHDSEFFSILQEFPPTSKLDVKIYGNQNSSIKPHHIEKNLNGLKVDEVRSIIPKSNPIKMALFVTKE